MKVLFNMLKTPLVLEPKGFLKHYYLTTKRYKNQLHFDFVTFLVYHFFANF